MLDRRTFLSSSAAATSGLWCAPWLRSALGAPASGGKPPMRFIFMHKGNGLFPDVMVPPSLSADDATLQRFERTQVHMGMPIKLTLYAANETLANMSILICSAIGLLRT